MFEILKGDREEWQGKKQWWVYWSKQRHYVLDLLEETVFYDEAECDGYCLKEDIGYWFDELEEQETVPLEEQETVQKGGKEWP